MGPGRVAGRWRPAQGLASPAALTVARPPSFWGSLFPLSPFSQLQSCLLPGRPPDLPRLPGRPVSSSLVLPITSRPDPSAPPVCGLHLTHRLRALGSEEPRLRARACRVPVSRCSRCQQKGFSVISLGSLTGVGFCDLAFREPAQVQRGCRASREPRQAVGAADTARHPRLPSR